MRNLKKRNQPVSKRAINLTGKSLLFKKKFNLSEEIGMRKMLS